MLYTTSHTRAHLRLERTCTAVLAHSVHACCKASLSPSAQQRNHAGQRSHNRRRRRSRNRHGGRKQHLHDGVVNRVVSFCACHHATSSFVRFNTDSFVSSSSAVFDEDPAEWLHSHVPPTLHEQPTTGSSSDALVSVGAAVTLDEGPEPRREPGPSAMHAASRDRKHTLRDRGIIAPEAPAVRDAETDTSEMQHFE